MVDVKVCGKCGVSIAGQAIIDGKARLMNGQLLCAECAASAAAPAPARPAPSQNSAAIALPVDDGPILLGQGQGSAEQGEGAPAADEITIFGGAATHHRAELNYKRQPTMTGQGAIRVKTFDSKLSRAAFEVLDEQINLWLDETGYEVKQVTTNIGEIHGKTSSEPHLIISIWY
jgi:hypothetical protein